VSELWWMNKSWGKACCASCGVNIQSTGGDPDWGYCYNCFNRQIDQREAERQAEHQHYEEMERQHWEREYARIEVESWSKP